MNSGNILYHVFVFYGRQRYQERAATDDGGDSAEALMNNGVSFS